MTELNLAHLHEAIAAAIPDRECIVHAGRSLTYGQVTDRTRRLARYLRSRGLGVHRERAELSNWESGQDHVALYMWNCPEYLEAMLGSFKTRAVPFNVNYRYVEEELRYLMDDAGARAVVYHARVAPMVARLREHRPQLQVLIQVPDDSGEPLLPGAVCYDDALDAGGEGPVDATPDPDDLYILYTGGTTGMPKGVLWRQADVYMAALGGRNRRGEETPSLATAVARAERGGPRTLPPPPMMHGAAHWVAFHTFHAGGTVVIQDRVDHFDPRDVLQVAAREDVQGLLLVGDAFGRPLLEELRRGNHHLPCLKAITNSGAPLSADVKRGLMERLPGVMIVDAIGSSESGQQGVNVSADGEAQTGRFALSPSARVISEDMTRVLSAGEGEGDAELGWLAQQGRVPLGYLGDPDKTARTFPVIDGVRYSVPGDRARLAADGQVEVLGRDSVTINSGGEKIFAEEVEAALKRHPDVYDVLVAGRRSERWGQEVCAVVQLRTGAEPEPDALIREAKKHLAGFKLPKAIIFREHIQRSPSGKPDYRWAQAQVREG
ncbi:MAG: acyl-CoA synthetase [Myxococcales bacterium]|jgi:acyl-CoA synthetase (AMP-forming)/AMP-acid ligase II